jgi:hypothetical protein
LIGLPLVPGGNQPIGILKHLSIGRTSRGRFLLGDLPALVLHLAAIEAHGLTLDCRTVLSS